MKFKKLYAIALLGGMLCSCNQQTTVPAAAKTTISRYQSEVNLHGTVSNNTGLLKSGRIAAVSVHGALLAETELANTAHYQLLIPAGTELPILLSYTATAAAADNKLLCVIVQPAITKYDINPLTTAIAKQAKALGGYTLRNLTQAAEDLVNVPDANKTSTGFRGDPTSQYGGWH